MAEAEVRLGSAAAGQFVYATLEAPVTLSAGTTYYLLSDEQPGTETFYSNVPVTPVPGLTVEASSIGTPGNPSWDTTTWTIIDTEGVSANGPVNFLYATAEVDSLGYPPDPPEGTRAAYLRGLGQIEQTITFTRAGTYAIRMNAAAREGQENSVRFYFDNQVITPNGEDHSGPRLNQWMPGEGFNRSSRRYEINTTYVFHVTTSGTHTLRIEGTGLDRYAAPGTPPDLNRAIYFDQIGIASADALFSGGIPGGGEANGQFSSYGYQQQLFTQQRYVEAFGLRPVAYEGGWSVGGDFNSNPFQNWCKYLDPRARIAQKQSIDIFARSGSRLYVFGTYETWPNESTSASADAPLAQAIDDHNASLPPEPVNGITVPNVIRPSNSRWQYLASPGNGQMSDVGSFFTWNILAPATGNYSLSERPAGVVLELNGVETGSSTVFLTRGLHTLCLRATAAGQTAAPIFVTQSGAPSAPTLLSAVEGDASATLTWSSVPGATAYVIRYGTTPGQLDSSEEVSSTNSLTLAALTNGTAYYFSVASRNVSGLSVPSNELGAIPVGSGQSTALATWEFSGLTGNSGSEPSDPPDTASGNAIVSSITRGPGLQVGYNQFAANTFASGATAANGNAYGTDLATAIARGQYYEITLAPTPGRTLSLERIDFRPSFQAQAPGAQIGAGITYRVGNGAFVNAPAATGTPVVGIGYGTNLSVNTEGESALQAAAQPMTIRVYLWGCIPYGCTGLGGPGSDLVVTGAYELLPASPLASWRTLHGLAADGSQDFANPSGDGISNFLKFAFHLAPIAGDLLTPATSPILPPGGNRGLPRIETTPTGWRLEYIRRKTGLTYQPEFSTNLGTASWSNVDGARQLTDIDPTWERVVETIPFPPGAPPSFLRIRVTATD